MGEEDDNGCGRQLRMGWAQTGAQFLGAVVGMLDSQDQNSDGLSGRGQLRLRQGGAPGGLLGGRHSGLGGEIHKMALVLFALEAGCSWNCQRKERGSRCKYWPS